MNQTSTHAGLVSYCGFYCGACKKYAAGECLGCKGNSPKCAVGYKACKVRSCNLENGYSTCADCEKYNSVKDCAVYNPFMIRFGQWITRTSRQKGIELIKEKGEAAFVKFMVGKNWVTVKTGK